MVGQDARVIGIIVGTRAFWKDELLNSLDCASMVNEWASRNSRGEPFYDLNEARAGDIVAFGTGWGDAMFGVYLDRGKIATTSRHPFCDGTKRHKMLLVRVSAENKPFIGGVRIE